MKRTPYNASPAGVAAVMVLLGWVVLAPLIVLAGLIDRVQRPDRKAAAHRAGVTAEEIREAFQ